MYLFRGESRLGRISGERRATVCTWKRPWVASTSRRSRARVSRNPVSYGRECSRLGVIAFPARHLQCDGDVSRRSCPGGHGLPLDPAHDVNRGRATSTVSYRGFGPSNEVERTTLRCERSKQLVFRPLAPLILHGRASFPADTRLMASLGEFDAPSKLFFCCSKSNREIIQVRLGSKRSGSIWIEIDEKGLV